MKTNILTVECKEVAGTSSVTRGQDNPHVRLLLIEPDVSQVLVSIIEKVGANEVLDHLSNDDIAKYLKGNG